MALEQPKSSPTGRGSSGRQRRLVLVVDDSPSLRWLARSALDSAGFDVEEAEDGHSAILIAHKVRPDLILLDLSMPELDGLDVLRHLRRTSDVPVVLVTARGHETDRVLGLDLGADDYVPKPFVGRELVARVRAVLRRSPVQPGKDKLGFGDLEIDTKAREVHVGGDLVDMTPREFDLLAFLSSSPRQAFSRNQLLEGVWRSSDEWQDPRTVSEHVLRLRKKIEPDPSRPRHLVTVRGVGYRFDP